MEQIFATVKTFLTTAGLRLLAALAVLVLGLKIVSFLCRQIARGKGFVRLDKSLQTFLLSFTKILLNILVFVSVAMILGVPTTSFVTILASAGVAIGLALQGSLSNFAGGLMLMFFKPFAVDDYIKVGDAEGTVHDITPFYTVLISIDRRRITLPNGQITNTPIINYTAEKVRCVEIKIGVAYGSDVDRVKSVLTEIAAAHPLVLSDPPLLVRMTDFGDSALEFTMRACTATEHYWTVVFDLREQIAMRFEQENIEIPFPQLVVHAAQKEEAGE